MGEGTLASKVIEQLLDQTNGNGARQTQKNIEKSQPHSYQNLQ